MPMFKSSHKSRSFADSSSLEENNVFEKEAVGTAITVAETVPRLNSSI
jgi:hypothetical protein